MMIQAVPIQHGMAPSISWPHRGLSVIDPGFSGFSLHPASQTDLSDWFKASQASRCGFLKLKNLVACITLWRRLLTAPH